MSRNKAPHWADHALMALIVILAFGVLWMAMGAAQRGGADPAAFAEGGFVGSIVTGVFMVAQRVIEAIRDRWSHNERQDATAMLHSSNPSKPEASEVIEAEQEA